MSPIPNEVMLRAVTEYAAEHGGFLHGKRRVGDWLKKKGYQFTGNGLAYRFGHLKAVAEEAGVLYVGSPGARSKAKSALARFKRWLKERPCMGKTWLLWQVGENTDIAKALASARASYIKKFGHDAKALYIGESSSIIPPETDLEVKTDAWLRDTYFALGSE